jgi:hypothetical protein
MNRMLGTLLEAGRVLSGKKPAGRFVTVFDDDVFIVSYPRSGNTWARFLIGNLVSPNDPVTFANVESRIPEIYLFPDRTLRGLPRPRILKSHECFDPRYKRVIYIVRDPRDVAVSYYHYAIKRKVIPDSYAIEEFVPRFLKAELDIQWSWAASWSDHVRSWVLMRGNEGGFLMLRYEDILQNTRGELAKVASLLGLDPSEERLSRAIQLSSADHMRELEKKQSQDWKLTKSTRSDKPFVRAASSGNWHSELPAASVAEIESAWGATMERVGYGFNIPSFSSMAADR